MQRTGDLAMSAQYPSESTGSVSAESISGSLDPHALITDCWSRKFIPDPNQVHRITDLGQGRMQCLTELLEISHDHGRLNYIHVINKTLVQTRYTCQAIMRCWTFTAWIQPKKIPSHQACRETNHHRVLTWPSIKHRSQIHHYQK